MNATGIRKHVLGEIVGGHNFGLWECRSCGTQTLLTPAGGSLRDCPADCERGAKPDFLVRRFLLKGGDCELVGEHIFDSRWGEGWDPKSPEDAEPGEWQVAT